MKNFQSGRYVQQGHNKSSQPSPINRAWRLDHMELIQLLGQADRELGRLDMNSDYIPNIDLFIKMHVLKEATQSSKIEGTQTNMEEALLEKEYVALDNVMTGKRCKTMWRRLHETIAKLQTLPFSARFIREAHKTLLQGVQGTHKQPGEFRHSQNCGCIQLIGSRIVNVAPSPGRLSTRISPRCFSMMP